MFKKVTKLSPAWNAHCILLDVNFVSIVLSQFVVELSATASPATWVVAVIIKCQNSQEEFRIFLCHYEPIGNCVVALLADNGNFVVEELIVVL